MADIVGGLNQAQARPPIQSNTDVVQAEIIEKDKEAAPNIATRALEERRQQSKLLNLQIEMLKANLDARMNPPFDSTLMKTAAGFLKPTKTGSFGESLGYAAEGAADEAEKQVARNAITDKMRLELMDKQQGISQQNLISEYYANRLGLGSSGTPRNAPLAGGAPSPAGSTPPLAGAIPQAPVLKAGQLPPSVAAPADRVGPTGGAMEMKPVTDRDIAEANFLDPSGRLAKDLIEQAKLQREDIIMIDGKPYQRSQKRFLEGSPDTMVERDFGVYIGSKKVPTWFAKQYDDVKNEAIATNKPELVFEFFKKYDMLQPSKAKDASGNPTYETPKERENRELIVQERLKAQVSEEKGQVSMLETNANIARSTENITKDIRSLAVSNKTAFDLLNNPGIADAVKRAAEKGITIGSLGNFSIPMRELESYKLSQNDREALQLLAQKMSQLTVQFRKSARAPGEGATTESEGRLYADLGALPSDTAKVIILKMDALEEKAKVDQAIFKAWSKFSKNPENSYREFQASGYEKGTELYNIYADYDSTLEKMRQNNSDVFRTSPKSTNAAKPGEKAVKPGESYSERLERIERERSKK